MIKKALLKYDISFYNDAIEKKNNEPTEARKRFIRAKFQHILGKLPEEVREMCERMDDSYFR